MHMIVSWKERKFTNDGHAPYPLRENSATSRAGSCQDVGPVSGISRLPAAWPPGGFSLVQARHLPQAGIEGGRCSPVDSGSPAGRRTTTRHEHAPLVDLVAQRTGDRDIRQVLLPAASPMPHGSSRPGLAAGTRASDRLPGPLRAEEDHHVGVSARTASGRPAGPSHSMSCGYGGSCACASW